MRRSSWRTQFCWRPRCHSWDSVCNLPPPRGDSWCRRAATCCWSLPMSPRCPASRSWWRCWRSTSWAMAFATRSTRGYGGVDEEDAANFLRPRLSPRTASATIALLAPDQGPRRLAWPRTRPFQGRDRGFESRRGHHDFGRNAPLEQGRHSAVPPKFVETAARILLRLEDEPAA